MKHLSDNNFNNNQLDNVPTPIDAGDATNKEYVDTSISSISKNSIGLGNVDNTSDANKPVSTAAQAALDGKRNLLSPPNKYVEAMSLYHIGHSYTQLPYPYSFSQYNTEYGLRVRDRLKMGDYHWHGRGGTFAESMVGRLVSPVYDNGTGLWKPNSKGVVMIENYTNELGSSMSSDSDFNNLWVQSIRAEIAIVSSKTILNFNDKTASSGSWTKYGQPHGYKMPGPDGAYYASSGYIDFPITQGDEAWICTMASVSSYSIAGVNVTCNGVNVGSFNGNGLKPAYNDAVDGTNYNMVPWWFKVTGLNAAAGTSGAKTVRLTAAGGGNTFLGGFIEPSDKPPKVFVAKEPPRGIPSQAQWTSAHAWYDSKIADIVSEFSNTTLVDLQTGFDATMYVDSTTDGSGIHPNDKGQSFIADKFTEAINSNITDWDEGVVSLS